MAKKDGQRWATALQIQWLLAWMPEYLEAQRTSTFPSFWPKLFRAWFDEYPCREPNADNKTDGEQLEDDSGSDVPPKSADERAVAIGKRKREEREKSQRKKTQKVRSICNYMKMLYRLFLLSAPYCKCSRALI